MPSKRNLPASALTTTTPSVDCFKQPLGGGEGAGGGGGGSGSSDKVASQSNGSSCTVEEGLPMSGMYACPEPSPSSGSRPSGPKGAISEPIHTA